MCFLCWLPISVLVKDHLSSFSPVILAGVEAMQESLALQGGAHRADGSSLHMSQRSPCWFIIHAHKGNIYFTSPVNSSWYKDSFYLLLLITMKKKMVLLKAPPPPPFFFCQHKWKCPLSYFPYNSGLFLSTLTLSSWNECSGSSFCQC